MGSSVTGSSSGLPVVPEARSAAKPPAKKQRPPRPSTKPKKGHRWVFQNNKWTQQKKLGFIESEVEKQISQSKQLAGQQQKYAQSVYEQLRSDVGKLAEQYKPEQYAPPSGEPNRWSDLYARTRGAEAAAQNLATLQTVGGMRSNLGRQQLEYARALRQQVPTLKMQYKQQQEASRLAQLQADLAERYKQQQLGLEYDKLASQERQTAARIGSQERRTAASIDASNRRTQAGIEQRLSKQQRDELNKLRKSLFYWRPYTDMGTGKSKRQWFAPKKQFRTSLEEIINLGYTPNVAARIAANWAYQSDKNRKKPATFKKGKARNFYQSMVNRGVSKSVADRVTKQYYPGFSSFYGYGS